MSEFLFALEAAVGGERGGAKAPSADALTGGAK